MKGKNMILKDKDIFENYTVEEIKYSCNNGRLDMRNHFKRIKKKLIVHTKVMTELSKQNPEIKRKWSTYNTTSSNHMLSFVHRIYEQVQSGFYKVEQLGKIEAIDDGSRGLARTFQMHLYDKQGNILDATKIHQNLYPY